ncbi:hypothetical protein [Brevibacillus nitrificans]|uniref:hypothetical protein n=1 Tax=Brevibacillus nitrificans TaxID=651560 RepID=UPI0028599300|nr:hypothetical protein [Brevibacillus nitrificans]MDR7313786.1 hypothetical protein [Brevibacillus nitrificans]
MLFTVSVFRDKKGVLLMIPFAHDEDGIRRNVNKPIVIEPPYQNGDIAQKLKECFEICKKGPYPRAEMSVMVYKEVTGISSYPKFSKERANVNAQFDSTKGYLFRPSKREKDGSYTHKEEAIETGMNPTGIELEEALMRAYEQCE